METARTIKVPTTGTFDFPKLILGGEGKYVDKTDILFRLASSKADAQFFISRPRRFGKSLMLSTLKAMFEGRRELFKGLAIDSLPWEGWTTPYPVYSLTMASATGGTYEKFQAALSKLVEGMCGQIGLGYDPAVDATVNFEEFLKVAAEKSPTKQVVVLIDEYDEPVAKFLDDLGTLKKVRATLHDFYEKLKICSGSIRFLMMTGVTKLTKLSVFSGMNHLTDISACADYATLLGYTPDELDGALRENVDVLGAKNGMDFAKAKATILSWYDGYRFSPDSEARVCNPVSIGRAFKEGKFEGYWETTGKATLVIDRIEKAGKMPNDLENVAADALMLDVCDVETLPMESLLYQGGYLTIKKVIPPPREPDGQITQSESYVLAPPNLEVRESLKRGYLSQVMGLKENSFNPLVDRAKRQIASGGIQEVVETMLFSLYAAVPPDWRIKDEAEAKRYFQMFFAMLGANPAPEFPSARGYADAVVERPDAVYVLEFKYGESSEAAIRQIRDRGYADKWIGGERPVTLVGINYSPKKRNIDIPVIEKA